MNVESSFPIGSIESYRERVRAFVEARDDPSRRPESQDFEIDVYDLMGFRGEILESRPEDWPKEFSDDPDDPNYLSPNMALTQNSEDFPELDLFNDNEGELELATERLLTRLKEHTDQRVDSSLASADEPEIARRAKLTAEPLKQVVNKFREPIRTVAINCLYLDTTPEKAARAFGTSVETIDFLTQVALDQLAEHV